MATGEQILVEATKALQIGHNGILAYCALQCGQCYGADPKCHTYFANVQSNAKSVEIVYGAAAGGAVNGYFDSVTAVEI